MRPAHRVLLDTKFWRNWVITAFMSLDQVAAFTVFGLGSTLMGDLGTSGGWAAFSITSILTANVIGLVQGDWRQAGRHAIISISSAVLLLILAVGVLAIAFVFKEDDDDA